jgi:hypothetical protein
MREPTNFKATGLESVLATQGRKARWLADQCQISESHLSRIVSGERRISETLARTIAGVLQSPLFFCFELTSESESLTEVAA